MLSSHHVNKLWVKQCTVRGWWSMMLTLLSSLDWETQSRKSPTEWPKKQSQYHYRPHLNKQTARYQALFIQFETVQEASFFWEAKQQSLETQTEETIVHGEGTHCGAVALKDGRLHGQHLESRKDIKAFPRVDRRIQGSGLTQRFLPKALKEVWEQNSG